MSNNKKIKKASLLITIFIVIIGFLGIWFTLSTLKITKTPKTDAGKIPPIKIEADLYEKISQPVSFGTSVSADEPGFGRENPFAPIN